MVRRIISLITNILILAFAFHSLSGCATPNISKQIQMNEDEGILIAKVHSNIRGISIHVHGKGSVGLAKATLADEHYTKLFMFGKLAGTFDKAVEFLKVVPIISGEAYFGRINKGSYSYVEPEPMYFNIEPGAINYVGDLFIDWKITDEWDSGYAQVRIIDREEETLAEARNKYPWLFDRYPYRKSVPIIEIENVEGFEEVEELRKLKDTMKDHKDESK